MAFEVWENRTEDTYYLIGSALGPYPYPDMVREFQSVIGKEVRQQFSAEKNTLPDGDDCLYWWRLKFYWIL